jgi:hypothetical protein
MKILISTIKRCALATASLAIVFASCKKATEAKPYSYFTTANFFTTVDEAQLATSGVYEIMKYPSTYGWYIPLIYDNDSDIQFISPGPTPDWRIIPHYVGIAETPFLYETWSAFYNGIDRANLVIDRIQKMDLFTNGTDVQKGQLNRMLGEAKFLRGFYYAELVRLWGDVPFKLKNSETGDNFKLPLTDRYEIYTQVIKDMQEGADLLPATLPTDERINKFGAKAMLARVALAAGGFSLRADGTMQRPANYLDYYRIAQTQIIDVIGSGLYALNPDYSLVFKNQSIQKFEPKESLFEAGIYTPVLAGTSQSSFGTFNAPQTAANPTSPYGGTQNRCFVTKTFFDTFKDGDLRRDFSIARYALDGTGNRTTLLTNNRVWAPAKWSREYQNNANLERVNTNINTVIMRYSDVLLMRAEVENELNNGPNDLAYEAINTVRRRAYGQNITGSRINVTLLNGGSGYTAVPVIKITGGGGSDASALATISGGKITAISMLNNGFGYTATPTITITNTGTSTGTGATANVTLLTATTTPVDLSGLDKDGFFKALQDERAWELCFEGSRKADLIRWNVLDAKIKATQAALKIINAAYPYNAADNFKTGKHELYPIPQSERNVNTAITRNNPGY